MSFDTILIANRGEIACRVIRTARAMGLRTVAVYSEADADAPHVRDADDAVLIGPAPVSESYFDGAKIIAAAQASGAGAIHPGYGFLSENAGFAEAVAAAGLTFIGPSPHAIRVMGDKAGSKRAMIAANVPCVPGYEGEDQSDARLIAAAEEVGFPVMVKASAGGGGRGMRLVVDAAELPEALTRARAEALGAFGSDILIVEKAVQRPRHVEVQVFADGHGNCIHLGERDCSVQRRHQKVLEESPCPVMTAELRARMGAAAVAAAEAVNYCGAGTVEFLLDDAGDFYFLEMNTRLQVEHPVTEMVTGLDLVALQIRVARGEALPLTQKAVTLSGHAIEARIYAEDPAAGFLPSTGEIAMWRLPHGDGIRVDAGIVEGGEVSPFYDPMLAKIIAHGETRDDARLRLIAALRATALVGPATNIPFLIEALEADPFAKGAATTAFIGEVWGDTVLKSPVPDPVKALAAALMLNGDRDRFFAASGVVGCDQLGWRSDGPSTSHLSLVFEDAVIACRAQSVDGGWLVDTGELAVDVRFAKNSTTGMSIANIDGRRIAYQARYLDGGSLALAVDGLQTIFDRHRPGSSGQDAESSGRITAPMPGLVVDVLVAVGDVVAKGAPLAVLEAMKMQHKINAPLAGTIASVSVTQSDQLRRGDLMVEITPQEG